MGLLSILMFVFFLIQYIQDTCSIRTLQLLPMCIHKSQFRLVYPSNKVNAKANSEFIRYKKRPYTKYVTKSQFYHYLQDEKEMMMNILQNNPFPSQSCHTPSLFQSFFKSHKQMIMKNCVDFRRFSHCQKYYLFQYDTSTKKCHFYYHENYIHKNYTGVTMTLILSPNRLDRLPLHLQRWRGPMSIAIQLEESELEDTAKIVSSIERKNIRFTFYVLKNSSDKHRCSFISLNGTNVYYNSCFVINELRNLAIETIETTHFMIVDGDAIISNTMENNIKSLIPLLSKEEEVLLFPLFPIESPSEQYCIETGDCEKAWKVIPQNKKQLIQMENYIQEIKAGHKIINYNQWKSINKNTVIELISPKTMEPYGIFKRTTNTPLFHPYFINYGQNKEQFYNVLKTMNYHFNVMTLDFAIDLPHPSTYFRKVVRDDSRTRFSTEMFYYFNNMFNQYCDHYHCNHFVKQCVKKEYLL